MASLNINDNGTWKQPREIYCKAFTQWFSSKEVYIKNNGTWVKVWSRAGQQQNYGVGGNVTQVGNYRIHTFEEGTSTFILESVGEGIPIEYLIVGGGGPGGIYSPDSAISHAAGGGGGGQVILGSEELPEGEYEVLVGAGGYASFTGSTNGGISSFNGVTALGGGAGATNVNLGGSPPAPPLSPCAGGGGDSSLYEGSPNTPGSGFSGGDGNEWGAGGGGGAVSPGGNGGGTSDGDSFCGDGGSGVTTDFLGSPTGFGGGGAGISVGSQSAIGVDGGGDANQNGQPSTGGGGGGLENGNPQGGSGIVAIRYLYDVIPSFVTGAELEYPGSQVSVGTPVAVTFTAGPSSPLALTYYYWEVDGEVVGNDLTYTPSASDEGKTLSCTVRLENRLGYAESQSNSVTVQG